MDIREHRNWMYNRFLSNKKDYTQEFVIGVKEFIEYVKTTSQYEKDGEMRCPCRKCENRKFLSSDKVHEHLLRYGFMPNYWYWIEHGEHQPHECNIHTQMASTSRALINKVRCNNSRLNSEGQRVWSNDRGKKTHEKYTEKYGSSSGEGDSDPPPTQIEKCTGVVGRYNKGQVFELARRASQRVPMMNMHGLSEREQFLTNKVADITQRMIEMESKIAAFEQKMLSIMQYPPHFPAPHSTFMSYPTVTAPMASPSLTTPMTYPPHRSCGGNATFIPTPSCTPCNPHNPHIEDYDADTD